MGELLDRDTARMLPQVLSTGNSTGAPKADYNLSQRLFALTPTVERQRHLSRRQRTRRQYPTLPKCCPNALISFPASWISSRRSLPTSSHLQSTSRSRPMSNLARLTEGQPVDGALLSDLNLNLVRNHGPTRPPWQVRGGTTWADHHRTRG
jgi:hypothetical protein